MLYQCSTGVCAWSMLLSLYIAHIAHSQLIRSTAAVVAYASNTQLYVTISKDNRSHALSQLEQCLCALNIWFCYNGLVLNPDKSYAIILGTAQSARFLPNISTATVDEANVPISDHGKLLGVTLDNILSFDTHISALYKSCFIHIRALRHIGSAVTTDSAKSIACSLIDCRLDHANCNSGRHLLQEYEMPPAHPKHIGSSCYSPARPHQHL